MKKSLSLILCLALMLCVFVGCTESTPAPAETEGPITGILEDPDISEAQTVDYSGPYADEYAPSNQSLFGWENDKDAPIAFLDGSFRLRDNREGKFFIRFGVGMPDSKIAWYNAEGYLPCLVSEYSKNGLNIKIENFSDAITFGNFDFEVAYSRVTMTNTNDTVINLPEVSEELIPLTETCSRKYISPNEIVVKEYAIVADRFGTIAYYPTDEEVAQEGGWEEHYAHMKEYWEKKIASLVQVTQLPADYEMLPNAYKATFIYSLIVNDYVDNSYGQSDHFTINVGENGYDGQWNHDAIGIVANYLTLGYTDNYLEYAEHLYSQDTSNYSDARMKYVWNFALYAMKTGDVASIRPFFTKIQQSIQDIPNLRTPYDDVLLDEDGNLARIMPLSNSIDSRGHWLIDNWSGLFGLAAYTYLCEELYENTGFAMYHNEAEWAREEQRDFIKSLDAVLNYIFEEYDFEYLPISLDVPNELSARSDPHDANWGAHFMFGRWAWDGYLFGAEEGALMTSLIDKTYAHCLGRREEFTDSMYNAGGYANTNFSSTYNAAYGSAAFAGTEYRDWAIEAYKYMIDTTMMGPYSWWESMSDPYADGLYYWDNGNNVPGNLLTSCPHMWGQANCSKVFIDALVSERYDDTLIIGRGIPNSFVFDGETVAFENFQYGKGNKAACTITTTGKTIKVQLELTTPFDVSVEIPALINNIEDAGGLEFDAAAGTVYLPAGTTEATITLSTAAADLD